MSPHRTRPHPRSESPLRVTDAAAALGTETAFAAAAAARRLEREGRDIVHLEIGEPGIPTPPHIVEAGERALRDGHTHYVSPAGIPELRDALAASLVERGVHTTAEHVIVTSGGKPGILYGALALIRPGDEVLFPDPGFPIYPSVIRLAGGTPVAYPVDLEASAGIDPDAIAERITPRTRVLILNEPNNPTGGTASSATLDAIAELVRAHDLAVISDEVYGRLRFTGRPESIAARDGLLERTVLVDNFSKTYAMTGWRLGWVVVPAPLREAMERLVINSTSCTAPFVQLAGVAALTGPQQVVDDLVARLRRTRDALVAGLRAIDGVRCPTPAGAFYAFPDIRALAAPAGLDDVGLATFLLERHGVATLGGSGFGPRGAGHLRLSYAAPPEVIAEAVTRLAAAARELATLPVKQEKAS